MTYGRNAALGRIVFRDAEMSVGLTLSACFISLPPFLLRSSPANRIPHITDLSQ